MLFVCLHVIFVCLCGVFCLPLEPETEVIVENACITTSDSRVPDTPCVFPFEHQGVVYEGCTVDPEDETKRWCSTKTNQKGKHVKGTDGFCSKTCPWEFVKG